MRVRVLVVSLAVFAASAITQVAFAAAPANDNFANAQAFSTSLPQTVAGDNTEATVESGETTIGGTSHSVWYSFTPTSTGKYALDTCNSDSSFDSVLKVVTGTAFNALTEVTHDDDSCEPTGTFGRSKLTFAGTSGTSYKIQLTSYDGTEQSFSIRLRLLSPPANDDFANAITLTGATPIHVLGTNVDATTETGESHPSTNASVWYVYTAPATRDYTVDLCNSSSSFDSVARVYTGSALTSLTQIATDDDGCASGNGPSKVSWVATSGTTYRISIAGSARRINLEESPFDLRLTDGSGGLYVGDLSLKEGDKKKTKFVFTVTLGVTSASPVTVHAYTDDVQCDLFTCPAAPATQGVDYQGNNADLTIKPGKRTATFTVQVIADRAYELDEGFKVFLTDAQGAVIAHGDALGTIKNDDRGPSA